MTERLFFTHDHLTAELEVLSCTAHEEQFAVTLQSTIFHPQGGGQPFDTGWLGDARVLRVTQEADRVVHYLDQPVAPGPINARVDAQRRALHTRLHSAGHLIGNAGEAWAGCRSRPTTGRAKARSPLSAAKPHKPWTPTRFNSRSTSGSPPTTRARCAWKTAPAKSASVSCPRMPVVARMSRH